MKKTQNVPKAPLVLPEIIGIDELVRAFIQAAIWRVYVSFVRALKKKVDDGQGEDDEEQEGLPRCTV